MNGRKWIVRGALMLIAVACVCGLFSVNKFTVAQTEFQVQGNVRNSICGYGIEGVEVEIATYMEKSIAITTTDAGGNFAFVDLPHEGPYELGFIKRGYRTQEVIEIMAGADLLIDLVPRGVTTPGRPNAISSPKSVYIDWPANPEFNLKGYNVYRMLVSEDGEPLLEEPVKLNGAPAVVCDDELVEDLEYIDSTVVMGEYYVYCVQAIGGADRPSELSEWSSPPVQGKWLTIFFPNIHMNDQNDYLGLYLWELEDGTPVARIPIASECAYDVDASSMQIFAELTSQLLNPDPFQVELTGITAGIADLEFSANIFAEGAVENVGDHQVIIAAADAEPFSLYGSGELFNIYMNPTALVPLKADICGPLHLVYDNESEMYGVVLYDDYWGGEPPVEVQLRDGEFCTEGGCIHGDVNMDGVVDGDDPQYILDFITRKSWATINDCYLEAWDINCDNRITGQDATLLLRFVRGLPINPPNGVGNGPRPRNGGAKSADLALELSLIHISEPTRPY